MKTPARFITGILLAAGIFFAGYMANRQKDPSTSFASAEQLPGYLCPMHPQYKSDRVGDCPICGMRLEPAEAGSAASSDSNLIKISSAKQQLIGIRTDEVKEASATHLLRVPGRITVDDQRLYRVVAAADGWIVDLEPNTVGRFVRKNEILATYYTRDLLGAEQLFLLSMNAPAQKGDHTYGSVRTGASLVPQYPVDTLRGLGMSDIQLEEIQKSRMPAPRVNVYSPASGFVLARDISPGQRFEKGTEFYRIADIEHVWVLTDIFERDREFIKPGAVATIRYGGREYKARLSDALPQLDSETRTLKTRFELDNPGHFLLPDMFVNVEIDAKTPPAITVPAESVIDSGRRKTVYVDLGDGVFEPRIVETGWRLGDKVQIVQGLQPGERIVVSGNFLIDSESRMQLGDNAVMPAAKTSKVKDAHAAATAKAKDPVCGMEVDPNSPNVSKSQYEGKTYYFCAEMCKKKFDANPSSFLEKVSAKKPQVEKDPVCGMDVDPGSPRTIKTEYNGKTYYFCAEGCKKSFEANPGKYVHQAMAAEDMHGAHMAE